MSATGATSADATRSADSTEVAPAGADGAGRSPVSRARCPYARLGIAFYRDRYIQYQLARGASAILGREPYNCADARWLATVWAERARIARVVLARWKHHLARLQAERRSLYEKWRCIHEHEGAWNAHTGNGYYGGLQMDVSFMNAYGREFIQRWGYAHRWPVWAQLIAAERAYDSGRGFGPWPNTRRMCGV